jgi:tRNA A-37 threonylcarbamoyl transferase component Bud32/dipeptidyl aminopeptidase/acylaminoacyl peptidase
VSGLIGTVIGAYEITGTLGAGGMGEVYRARDTRLKRDVALKLLPPDVAGDADRLARFHREAQMLAALNHPNVAHVYGIEQSDSIRPAIAMELVPGRALDEVLQDAMSRGVQDGGSRGLPLDQVISIGAQVAAALEAAHEHGIVHRDLKPSNIRVRDDGVVKVLDFGLAKADGSSPHAVARDSGVERATMTSPAMTEVGVILGTAAYMAPEQARGRPVDKRADIWAYGAVLFELLTGERLFAVTQTVTETLASVIKDDLRLDRLPADVPPALRLLIARCLERDPAQRLRDIGEARILLTRPLDPIEAPLAPTRPERHTRRTLAAVGAAGLLVVALAAAAATWAFRVAAPQPLLRMLDLAVPPELREISISNDGTRVAYLAGNEIYVRRLDELEPTALGSVHVTARALVWAPDDRAIAFSAAGTIQTISAAGGQPFVVAPVPGPLVGMAWLSSDTIVFSIGFDALYTAPATGGTPVRRLAHDSEREIDFHEVAALPGNRVIVSTHRREDDADIEELVELSGDRHRITLTTDPDIGAFKYLETPDGATLLFVREGTNAGVWSTPFTTGALDLSQARLLVPGAASYSVARDGTVLATIPARERRELVWVDANGVESRLAGAPIAVPIANLELSPDGRRAAFVQGTARSAGGFVSVNGTVVVRDLETGIDTPLAPAEPRSSWGDVSAPTWSPDGLRIVHRMGRVGSPDLVDRRSDVAGTARTLTTGEVGRLLPDGRTFIFTRNGRLHRTTLDPDGRVGEAQPLFPPDVPATADFDLNADGRLIAYSGVLQGGRANVYVAAIADPREQWLVQEGARRPRFSYDGRHVYFTRGSADQQGRPRGELVRRTIATTPQITFGPPEILLQDAPGTFVLTSYDVAPDGRLLMFKPEPTRGADRERLLLVQNASEVPSRGVP